MVEHFLGKEEVRRSNRLMSTILSNKAVIGRT